jgi:hypothetical protein
MATKTASIEQEPAHAPSGVEALAAALLKNLENQGAALEAIARNQPRRQKSIADYVSPNCNPRRLKMKDRPQFSRVYHQHGHLLDRQMVTDEQTLLLERLKPGTFAAGLVTVSEKRPSDGGPSRVDISYRIGREHDHANAQHFRTFDELLELCIREHAEQRRAKKDALRAELASEE